MDHLAYGTVLRRALAAGVVVGVALAVWLALAVEPVIDEAVALEQAATTAGADGHDHDDPLFSRGQQVAGGMAAVGVTALVVAAAFGTVYAATRHRLPGRGELARTGWLAAVGFGALSLVPALALPADPPGVGDPATIGHRSLTYVVCLATSGMLAAGLTRLAGWLRGRLADHTRVVVLVLATAAGYVLLLVALPADPDVVGGAVPADLVWDFRVRSLAGLALLWGGLGTGLGWLLERDAARADEVALSRR